MYTSVNFYRGVVIEISDFIYLAKLGFLEKSGTLRLWDFNISQFFRRSFWQPLLMSLNLLHSVNIKIDSNAL